MSNNKYESPQIHCYEIDVDSIMNEYSIPKDSNDGTDEQLSKKNFFDNELEDDSDSKWN
jgi:hypothetical protein